MKRLVLFASIFGAGLLILVFALGPSRLWRRTPTSSIQPQDLPPAPDAISMSTPGQRFGIGMRGAGTIPFWTPVPQPDGSSLRVKQAQLKYAANEPYRGGIHLTSPILDLFPAKVADEKAVARVTAAGGYLESEGDLRNLAESLKQQQIKMFSLSPDVRLAWLGEDDRPALTVETSQLDIPEAPSAPEAPPSAESPTDGEEKQRLLFPRLLAPNPVHVFAADGGFDLNAAGLELQRIDGRLDLRGPITLNATHFALPASGNLAAAPAPKSKPAAATSNRPPITLTCDGHATFVQRPLEKPDKNGEPKGAAKAAREPTSLIGPGTLLFERNVVVRQSDPLTRDERRMRSDWLKLEVEKVDGELTVTRLDAGGGAEAGEPVAFELLGGEGGARHLTREGDDLTLAGPVHLDRMTVGRGSDARLFSLSASERLVMHEEAATGDGPARWRAELYGAAHATAQDELDADGEKISAVLRKVEAAADAGGDAATFDVDELVIDGKARLDMHARGKASGDRITLGGGGRGARRAHLEGDAVVTSPRGMLHAPTIDLTIPEARPGSPDPKDAPLRGSTPQMSDGRMALPAGGSLFGESGTAPEPTKPQRPRELRLDPLAPTSLDVNGEELHLRGRTLVRLFELATDEAPEREAQRLTADSLDLLPASGAKGDARGEPQQLVADGAVDVVDLERGFHLEAAHARTEPAADGHRHLLLTGAPAKATIALPVPKGEKGATAELTLLSTRLDVDLETRRIVADDRENLVTALVPETLVGTMLPSGFGVLEKRGGPPAELPPLEFHAEHVDVTPQEPKPAAKGPKLPPALAVTATSDNPFMRSLVNARGRVHALRRSDGSTFDAETMVLDLAAARARLDGVAGAPVKLLRPKAYASDRVEQVITDWLEAVDGGAKVTMAPRRDGPVMVLFPEGEPEPGRIPKRMRVALQCSEPPVLSGDRLLLTGGVDTDLEIGGDHDPDGAAKAHSRSERVEVLLSGPLGEPNLSLVQLTAQGRVRLDYERIGAAGQAKEPANGTQSRVDCHAEGARLTFDFKTGDLVLKEGIDPCRLIAADETGGWGAAGTFTLMTGNLLELERAHNREGSSRTKLLAAEFPSFRFQDFHLVAEGPRER